MKQSKNFVLFLIGGGAYVALELAFRGRSHWTMFCLGGICFLLIGHLGRQKPRMPVWVQILLGSLICTFGELLFGMIFNRDYTIWDYRQVPGNFLGQVCPMFTLLWIPVSFLAVLIFDWFDEKIPERT